MTLFWLCFGYFRRKKTNNVLAILDVKKPTIVGFFEWGCEGHINYKMN